MKNNRPVKIIEITKEGIEKAEDAANKIRPHYKQVKERIKNSDIAKVGDLLKELRNFLSDTVDIQI
jgi:DNA-binding PadR family transcriptional regulator